MLTDQHAAWATRLLPPSLDARLRLLPRVAGGIAILLLTLAVAGHLLSARRLADARHAVQSPAATAGMTHGAEPGPAPAAADLTTRLDRVAAVQRATVWVLAGAGAAALLLLAALYAATRVAIEGSVKRASDTLDAIAAGRPAPPAQDGDDGIMGTLDASLRRLARQMRGNAECVQALADGAFRRATLCRTSEDPIGTALLRLTYNMEATALAAQRIARGDLSVRVVPQSEDDAFGESCSAMVRRVKHVLREVEQARGELSATIAQLRSHAEALASSAGIEADALRRATEQLSRAAVQASADAARAATLAERSASSERLAGDGRVEVERSVVAMQEVLRHAAGVQALARDAGLLAVESTGASKVSGMEDRARRMAGDAAAAAAVVARLHLAGSDAAHEARLGLDQLRLATREGTSVARELETTARDRADRLGEMDGALDWAREAAAANALTARQLASRVEALAGQVQRLDGVLRRFGWSDRSVSLGALVPQLADGPRETSSTAPTLHDFLGAPGMRASARP